MPTQLEVSALVLGSSGFLGSRYVKGAAVGVRPLDVGRLTNQVEVRRAADRVSIELARHPNAAVVNFIGLRHGSRDRLNLINEALPRALVEVVSQSQTRLVHIGSAAEVAEPISDQLRLDDFVPSDSLVYGESKAAGSGVVASSDGGVVLRVYNLYGLPHQNPSGLHELCLAHRALTAGEGLAQPLTNTIRDYVAVRDVIRHVDRAVAGEYAGLVEVCSGVGVSLREIADALPGDAAELLKGHWVEPNLFGPVIGLRDSMHGAISRRKMAALLAEEVFSCASS